MKKRTRDRLVLLGTKGGPSLREKGSMPTSSLLEIGGKTCVVDCGLGVTRSLVEAGASLKEIDYVFVTHLHSDHVLELGPLLHTAWTTGLTRGITVFGPSGTDRCLEGFYESLRYDIAIRIVDEGRNRLPDLVELKTIAGGPLDVPGLEVRSLRVHHPPVDLCYALRFDWQGRSITFSSDTAYFPPLIEFARGSDILVHEAMLERGVDRIVERTPNSKSLKAHLLASHTEARDVGRIAKSAGVGKLVLHHLVPSDDPSIEEADWVQAVRSVWDGEVVVGSDGLEVGIGGNP